MACGCYPISCATLLALQPIVQAFHYSQTYAAMDAGYHLSQERCQVEATHMGSYLDTLLVCEEKLCEPVVLLHLGEKVLI